MEGFQSPTYNDERTRAITRANAQYFVDRPFITDQQVRELNDLGYVPKVDVSNDVLENIEESPAFKESKLPPVYTQEQTDYYKQSGGIIPEGKLLTALMTNKKRYA